MALVFSMPAALSGPASAGQARAKAPLQPQAQSQPKAHPLPRAQPQSITFGDWVVECVAGNDGTQHCLLRQTLTDDQGRKIVEFIAAKSDGKPYLEVSAPLGLSIPYGITLRAPEKNEFKMQLLECAPTGCRAVVPIDDKVIATLKAARTMEVMFQDSKSGKVLTITGSLKGFAQGIAVVLAAS
ncbi:MAG: invasion associated locus B family protein [Pseudomonadota bacterium]|nr:invasion associated locus B family protein [Pseudomonadota bacterium]